MYRTCIEIKQNGVQCGSPALRTDVRCHFHARDALRRYYSKFELPPITDFEGRKFAINEIYQGVLYGMLDPHKAHALLYAIRLSMKPEWNQDFKNKAQRIKDLAGLHGLNR